MAFLSRFLPVRGEGGGRGREVAIQEHSLEFLNGITSKFSKFRTNLRAKFVVIQILAVSKVKKVAPNNTLQMYLLFENQ